MTASSAKSSEEKSGVQMPTFNMADVPQVAIEVPKKSRLTKKHVLVTVAAVVALGLILATILVALRFITEAHKDIVKYSMSVKDGSKGTVNETVSVDKNVVEYTVVRDGSKMWIIQDYERSIQVAKVQTSSGVVCYASPMNKSLDDQPKSVPSSPPSANSSKEAVMSEPLKSPIKDINFLGKRVSAMCANIPTYWEVQKCGNEDNNQRQKRGLCVCCAYLYYCNYYYCFWYYRCWYCYC